MARNDVLKRYLDAGLELTGLTQARAEAIVKDLVKAGEVQADQAREAVSELVDRSRRTSERLIETVRSEVREQITSLGLASQSDLDRLEERISGLLSSATASLKGVADRAPGSTGAARPAKKATAKAATAAKKATKKASAKKATAKRAPAKAASRATSSAKKATRTPAKKATAAKKTTKKA